MRQTNSQRVRVTAVYAILSEYGHSCFLSPTKHHHLVAGTFITGDPLCMPQPPNNTTQLQANP
jgi:hypothetical protein